MEVIFQKLELVIYQKLETMKALGVWNPWWNPKHEFLIYYFSNKLILEGEIKDAKMSSFSSDFQTVI